MLSPKKLVVLLEIIFFALIAMLYTELANAHARFTLDGIVSPRSTSDGIKTGPCGNVPRSNNPAIFSPGQEITVEWEETIDHPGYYRIAFSPANDEGYDENVLAVVQDDQDNTNLPHFFSTKITLPNTTCTDCSLQLIQYMTEREPPTLYYSCADIVLEAGDSIPKPVDVTNLVFASGKDETTYSWEQVSTQKMEVLILQGNESLTESPQDEMNYNVGDSIGNAIVVYKGFRDYFVARNLFENSNYHFNFYTFDNNFYYSTGVSSNFTQPVVVENDEPPGPVSKVTGLAGDGYVQLEWENPGNDFYKVLIVKNSIPVTDIPNQKIAYNIGDLVGSSEVVFNGLNNKARITQLSNGSGYHFRVFAHDAQFNYSVGIDNFTELPEVAVNEAPLVSLVIKQGGKSVANIDKKDGYVTMHAIVSDGNINDTHLYDWTGTDTRLIDVDAAEDSLTFDPGMLANSVYNISVTVTDNGSPPASTNARISILIDEAGSNDEPGGGSVGHLGLLILLLMLHRYYSRRTRKYI